MHSREAFSRGFLEIPSPRHPNGLQTTLIVLDGGASSAPHTLRRGGGCKDLEEPRRALIIFLCRMLIGQSRNVSNDSSQHPDAARNDAIRTPRINISPRTRTNGNLGIFTRLDIYLNQKESSTELSAERRGDRLNIPKQIENIPRADPLKFPAKRIDPRQPAELPMPRSSD